MIQNRHFSSKTAAFGSAEIGSAVSQRIIVVGDVDARKSSRHIGRLFLNSFSPCWPYRLFDLIRGFNDCLDFFVCVRINYLISHSVLLITTRSGFSSSLLNSSNNRHVTSLRHLQNREIDQTRNFLLIDRTYRVRKMNLTRNILARKTRFSSYSIPLDRLL